MSKYTKEDIIPGETFQPTQHIKVYVVGMKDGGKGPRVQISRTKANMVRRLFELEVPEIQSGVVQIKSIAREAGFRTKVAVHSTDPQVDPVGACVGQRGVRVERIVNELHNEKIDIIEWDPDFAIYIAKALSPAKVLMVYVNEDEKAAKVIVPDNQLSLAIGKEGQNARLAAKLTGYKIDIKSETQAKDAPGFRYEDYLDDEYYDEYEDEEYSDEEYAEEEYADEEAEPAGTDQDVSEEAAEEE